MTGPQRVDIPLSRDASARFLPWMVAFLTYVAALAFAGFLSLQQVSAGWTQALEGSVTVEIVPAEGEPEEETEDRVRRSLDLLRSFPGVVEATVLPEAEVLLLLEPWIGSALDPDALPLPRLIDVAIAPGEPLDIDLLNQRLAAASGAVADDHGDWQRRLSRFLSAMEWAALAVVSVVAVAAVIMVAFATRGSLSTHRETIELLHLIGAPDAYIARQFQGHAMRLAFIGSVFGALLAGITVFVIGNAADGLEAAAGLALLQRAMPVLATLTLPPIAAIVALVTARRMVMSALRRMV